MTLELEMPPNLGNARMHWRVKNKERQRYFDQCDLRLAIKRLPEPPATPLTPVVLRFTFYLGGRMDDDNCLYRAKFPVDWLRTRGYIEGDGHPHCRMTIPEQVMDRKHPRLVITIEHGQ